MSTIDIRTSQNVTIEYELATLRDVFPHVLLLARAPVLAGEDGGNLVAVASRTPLPAEEDDSNVYLTADTLDDPLDASITNHIFYGSKADWEKDAEGVRYFVERSSGPQVDR